MTRSEVLRELYEALERLDASQTRARSAYGPLVVDLRDPLPGLGGGGAPRVRPGADWVREDPRW